MKLQEVECECGRTHAGAMMATDVARMIQKAKHDAMMEAAKICKERDSLKAQLKDALSAQADSAANALVYEQQIAEAVKDKARLVKALDRIGLYFAGTENQHVSDRISAVLNNGMTIDEACKYHAAINQKPCAA